MAGGLLDFAKTPMGMGLLSAAFGGLAGANRNTPYNNLGRAGLAGIAGYSAADALQQNQAKLDEADRVKKAIPGLYRTDANGQTSFDALEAARMGINPKLIADYAAVPNAGRAKVARTMTVPGADGKPMTVQYDDFGAPVGEGVAKFQAPVQVNDGQTTRFVEPVAGQSFQQQLSPSDILANQRSQQGLNLRQEANDLARQSLNFKQGQQTGDGYSNKPLPAAALKIQDEALSAYGAAGNIQASLDGKLKQIEDGKLKFGPLSNVTNKGLNAAGLSNEESRNYASFMSDLERLRNESLRLNTGVQTDGDAQRAWNELLQNINDTDLVKQRIQEIKSINARGAELQRLRIDGVRSNYNAAPYDLSQYDNMAPPAPAPAQPDGNLTNSENPPANPVQPQYDPEKEARYQQYLKSKGLQP